MRNHAQSDAFRRNQTQSHAPITEEKLVPLCPRLHPARLALLLTAGTDPIIYRYTLERRVEAADVVGAGTSVAEQQLVAVHPPACKEGGNQHAIISQSARNQDAISTQLARN